MANKNDPRKIASERVISLAVVDKRRKKAYPAKAPT
jgi:hypothetical protein